MTDVFALRAAANNIIANAVRSDLNKNDVREYFQCVHELGYFKWACLLCNYKEDINPNTHARSIKALML